MDFWIAFGFLLISLVLMFYQNTVILMTGNAVFSLENLKSPINIIILACLGCSALVLLIGKIIDGKHPLKEAFDKYVPQKNIDTEDIDVCAELNPWKKDIDAMCQKLGIKYVSVKTVNSSADLAFAHSRHFQRPTVNFSLSWLLMMNDSFSCDTYDAVLFILGHELAHIKTGDSYNRYNRKTLGILLLLFLVLAVPIAFINRWLINGNVIAEQLVTVTALVLIAYMLFMIFVVSPAHEDIRYWGQVNELRADRIGFQISGISVAAFKELAEYLKKFQTDSDKWIFNSCKSSWHQKFLEKMKRKLGDKFRDKTEDDPHPSWDVRIREIEKYGERKWGMRDEMRYMWRFSWNMRFHHEWRL